MGSSLPKDTGIAPLPAGVWPQTVNPQPASPHGEGPDTSRTAVPSLEDRILEATAAAANALLTSEEFDAGVCTALRLIGEALDTDRVNVIENFEPDTDAVYPSWRALGYEWNSPGTVSQHTHKDAAQGSYREIEWLYTFFSQGGQTASYLIGEMPEPFRRIQEAIGVKSTHVVPIFVEGQWWGAIAIDDCRVAKRRSAVELSMVRIAADCIGCAIQRQRTQEMLLQAEQARVAELAQANQALQQRDRLLSTVAEVTKDLLENSHATAAIAQALQRIGQAAAVSRIALMQEKPDQDGRLRHHVIQEWTATGIVRQMNDPVAKAVYNDDYGLLVQELHGGRAVWRTLDDLPEPARAQQARIGVKSTGAVPIFVASTYFGCVGFDDCWTYRQWTPYEMDVLASAAGAIGAALHRQQLIDCLVEERIYTEQQRTAELTQANETLQRSLTLLAQESSLDQLLGCVLRAMVDQLGLCSGGICLYDDGQQTTVLHLNYEDGELQYGSRSGDSPLAQITAARVWDEQYLPLLRQNQILIHHEGDFESPAYAPYREHNRRLGLKTLLYVPMLLGEQFLGIVTLRSTRQCSCRSEALALVQALAHQATLAIQLTRLAEESKQAAVLDERNRLARDVHDTLAQAFTGVMLQLEATRRKLDSNQLTVAHEHIARARGLARAGLSEARRSVRALRPATLESHDLPRALHHLAQQMTDDTRVRIEVDVFGAIYPLTHEVEDNLLRVAQEALTNALRHAEPHRVRLQLRFTEAALHLHIEDDGIGFDPQRLAEEGFGLLGMEQRSHRINADFRLKSQLGKGTNITVTIPTAMASLGNISS